MKKTFLFIFMSFICLLHAEIKKSNTAAFSMMKIYESSIPPLPKGAVLVEYIQGDNRYVGIDGSLIDCVIDTGITPNLNTDIWVCDAQFLSFGNTAGCWGSTVNRFAFGRGSVSWNDWYFGFGDKNNRTGANYDYDRHIFILNGPERSLTIDDKTYIGSGNIVTDVYQTCAIFNRNNVNGINRTADKSNSRCYRSSYYRNGELIQDLIPIRIGDKGYMYDLISKRLFGNLGISEFIIGPDVR